MNARRLFLILGVTALLTVLLPGCGNGGGAARNATTGHSIFTNTPPDPTPVPSPGDALADLGVPSSPTISGTVSGNNFTIPAGTTRTATGDLTVVAQRNITINGNLLVPPNAKVYLVAAERIDIAGLIGPVGAAVSKPVATDAGWLEMLLGVPAHAGPNDNLDLPGLSLFARTISVSGVIVLGEGSPAPFLSMTTIGAGTIDVTGVALAGRGAQATATTPPAPGGTLTIGTLQDVNTALALNVPDVVRPKRLTGSGQLRGGPGGVGLADGTGTAGTGTFTFNGGVGGVGGEVRIQADSVQSDLIITGGSGGQGGIAGAADTSSIAPSVGASPPSGGSGVNVTATSGNGGNGGPAYVNDRQGESGQGGAPGNVFVAAGNGGASGRGGDLSIQVGNPGSPHEASTISATVVRVGPGGKGGSASTAASPGGAGGNLTITGPTGFVLSVPVSLVAGTGAGGAGGSGCGVVPPVPGSAGGAGGQATISGGSFGTPSDEAFVGGAGGSGTPPGAGGPAGRVGGRPTSAGATGQPCQ